LAGKARPIYQAVLTIIYMERTANQPIIADSSALVSLAIETDHNHKPAITASEVLRKTSRPIILPTVVFVETINILGKKSGHETALKAAGDLLRPNSQFVLHDTKDYFAAALRKFKDQAAAVSLTDCLVMAIADNYNTKDIFGFDKQFEDAGYHRLTPSTEWK
jgi:predicted nucleic acid-binding protein